MNANLESIEALRRPRHKVQGISAVLLPYRADGRIDESAFRRHLRRTLQAGLGAAVNMDTGYAELLTPEEKKRVLQWTASVAGGETFVAGALPLEGKESGPNAYARECETIRKAGGVPIIFPSGFTAQLDDHDLAAFFSGIARVADRFLAFELGPMFSSHGRLFSPDVLRAIMDLSQCAGLKHSSLDRGMEIDRLRLRDKTRPGFAIYSGNDLAMDMIEYGSDYLLGLSTLAPEAFAARDQAWREGAGDYLELRDAIQYLGWVAFRDPVPAYKHSAAIFLKLTGGLECDATHPRAQQRQPWDRSALADAARRVERVCPSIRLSGAVASRTRLDQPAR